MRLFRRSLLCLLALTAVLVFLFQLDATIALITATILTVVVSGSVASVGGYCGDGARKAYLAVGAIAVVASFWSTFHYSYFPDGDTHVFGWPIPYVIFHRREADGPWLDYVGLTTLFGWPANAMLFMFVPAVLAIGYGVWQRRRRTNEGVPPTSNENATSLDPLE